MMKDIHYRSLRQFLLLADTLHFAKASEKCNTSPSSLTRTIKDLEENLGVVLFYRDNRRVELTNAGVQLQDFARGAIEGWDGFLDEMRDDDAYIRGEIAIYCSVTASYSFLYDILSDFRKLHPRIDLKLHTGDPAHGINRILAGTEDIAIIACPEKLPGDMVFRRMADSHLVFIAPHEPSLHCPLTAPISDAEWQKTPMIVSEAGVVRERLDNWFESLPSPPQIYAQVAGHEAIVSMVSLGFGIGVVPELVLNNSPLMDSVKILSPPYELGSFEIGLCALRRRLQNPVISAFWESL